jgi:type II secretory pathway component PulJ
MRYGRTHRRHRRGFSLVDVAIGVALLSVATIVSARFIVSITDNSAASLVSSNSRRTVVLIDEKIESDFSGITTCATNIAGSAFVGINDSAVGSEIGYGFAFYTDLPDKDEDGRSGTVDLVAWRVNGNNLQRTEIRNTGPSDDALGCETLSLATATWVDIANPILAPTEVNTTFFQGSNNGISQPYSGSCSASDAQCSFDGLRVRFTYQPVGGGPVSFDSLYEIPTSARGADAA